MVLQHDPLRDGFGLPSLTVPTGAEAVILGRTEDGITLGHAIADPAHLGVQGQNGSGKSAFCYGLLSQLAAAPDVLVAGSDITGLLLGRAWDDTAHRPHQVTGTADIGAHAVLLEDLVAEMDRRLEAIPPRRDKIEPTPETPTVLVVLEEFPGLLRAADGLPKPKRGEGVPVGDRIRTAVLRLLSEGRKAAFRVLMLAQRFEATAVGGGYARDQFALRLSFRVPADSLEMLHGTDARPLGQEHANAAPGVAYLSGLGRDCERIRVPYLGEYGEYCDRLAQHGTAGAPMNLTAIVIIAALVTVLLVKSHKAAPALVSGVVTLVLLFAAFPDARAGGEQLGRRVRPPARRRHRPRR